MSKTIQIQFDTEKDELVLYEKDITHRIKVHQLREAKEVFARYDEANFIHDEDEEIDAFHEFAERMAKLSPECLDVASPYLN